MAREWKDVRFQDLFSEPLRNGLTRPKAVRGVGTRMVNMGEIFSYSRLPDIQMDRVPLSAEEAERYLLQSGDLLFARQSLVLSGAGKCCYVLPSREPRTFESHIIRARLDVSKADPLFYYYYFNSPLGRQRVESIVEQVAAAGIRGRDLAVLDVPIPKLKEQEAIAHILGTLDDKIELNRRMNRTLESIARAVFKSWFVDFDPVRAKVDGRQPAGMDAETAALFPDSFEDSPLGKIPKGWEVIRVEDVASKVACGPFGSSIKVSTFVEDGVPVISGQHLKGARLLDEDNNFITTDHADRLKNANVCRGDVIFTHAGSIGQVALVPETSRYDRYVLSQRQFYLRCNKEMTSPLFMVHYFKTPDGQHKLLANTSSTGVPSISAPVSYLKSIEFVLPQKQIIDRFDNYMKPMFLLAGKIENESKTLIAIRDTLLPKLISGDIRVKDAEKFVEQNAC